MKRCRAFTGWRLVSKICLGASLMLLVTAAFGQAPACNVSGQNEILIQCDYDQETATTDRNLRLVLRHSTISFQTDEENYMRAELTFENPGRSAISASYPVYLAINDESGNNYFKRRLPNVDLSKVTPGTRLTFSDRLLMPALRPGRYTVQLWIPRPAPSLQFDPGQNFLLSSRGMADPKSGLNKLATMTIVQ